MDSNSSTSSKNKKPIGVLGTGSFGAVISRIIAKNRPVYLYSRSTSRLEQIKREQKIKGWPLDPQITLTSDLELIANACDTILPMVPSQGFKALIKELSPFLRPYHMLIHGTKGLDITFNPGEDIHSIKELRRSAVSTMSEVIIKESVVIKVGCLAGPNISWEIGEGLPAATVVASHFDEVILEGKSILNGPRFGVFSSKDLIGVELCGVLKNVIALAAGAIHGKNLGQNAFGLLISRGLVEMVALGEALGGNIKAFIGLAGIGDMVTTATSSNSRNFTFGKRFAAGESIENILNSMDEVAEGYNTVLIMKKLADEVNIKAPILETIYKVILKQISLDDAIKQLMSLPQEEDISFL